MSGEHRHQDYEEAIIALGERVTALEQTTPPEPEPSKYLWQTDYTLEPWHKNHGIRKTYPPTAHDVSTNIVDSHEYGPVVQVDCLSGTSFDEGGCCYGITDHCAFYDMGITDDELGLDEFYWKGYFLLPADWCDTEDDVRWRTRTGSYKLLSTLGSYDPKKAVNDQPFSNNFNALSYASNLGMIAKGPPSATDYDRDRARPSTFFSVVQAAREKRAPTPNGQAVSMIQKYWHLNPNPADLVTGVGSASKPWIFITRNEWHSIEIYVRVNTAGKPDGEYKGWWDGELAMHINDLQMMPTVERGINVWHNQYFHGGPEGCDRKQTMYLGPAAISDSSLADF